MSNEMKETGIAWIGKIPNEWRCEKAKFHFVLSNSRGNKNLVLLSATQTQGVIPKDWLDGVVQVSEDTDLSQFKTVHINDFVISLRSFQGGFEISSHEGVITPAYSVFRAKGKLTPSYFKYLFKSIGFISKMNSLTVGIREGKTIQYEDFGKSEIPIPPIMEQIAIADFLNKECNLIDSITSDLETQIALLKQYKQSLITETVTKGFDKNVKMKDSGIPWVEMIPDGWSIKRIKFLIDGIKDGTHGSYTRVDDGELLLSAKNVFLDGIHLSGSDSMISICDYKEIISSGYPKYNDILLCCVGTVGRSCVYKYNRPIAFQRSVMFLRPNDEVIPEYLNYCLQSYSIDVQEKILINKTAQDGLYMNSVLELAIACPTTIKEQNAIVNFLDKRCSQIDAIITDKQTQLETLKKHKQSLIYEYVTGKKRVAEVA